MTTTDMFDDEEFNNLLRMYIAAFALVIIFVIIVALFVRTIKQLREMTPSLSSTSTVS